ncbi:MAG: glycogen debranching N-terminal domain-containing protein [Verrucomicrobiales bacterium]
MNPNRSEHLKPASMQDLLGYSSIECKHQNPVDHAMVLKHNRYFFTADPHGDISPPGHCGLGLFFDDTRILSHYALRLHGGPPSLLSNKTRRSFLGEVDLAIDDTEFGGVSWDPKNCVHVRREILLEEQFMERVTLSNYLLEPIDFWFELEIGCDFADIFEVRGRKRERRGDFFALRAEDGKVIASYRGLDGKLLESIVEFHEPLPVVTGNRARWETRLAPNGGFEAEWQIYAEPPPGMGVPGFRFDEARLEVDRTYDDWTGSCARWTTNLAVFQDTLTLAMEDLHTLHVESEGAPVISAGVPWFSSFFGRDSIITSLQTLSLNPTIARDTLRNLARLQGSKEDAFTEEEPGKIMHELRRGEMARNRETPHLPYYGTVDATPLWLVLLHETWLWTGDEGLVRELMPHAERALEWIDRFGDSDGDGFVEYRTGTEGGLVQQGWKDSGDGVPFPDGSLPAPPIALVEVQGYVYDAKIRMAELYELAGEGARSQELREQAAALREAIVSSFWMEDAGTFALALDGAKNRMPTITSNAGHLLWSGVPDEDQARRMTEVLLGPAMYSGWGIRTLSSTHPVYNPMSYHNGSVWPHDNAIIVMGLSRYQRASDAVPVVRGLHDAAVHDEFQRLPELFCGMPRDDGRHPVFYPVSCSPQAWASGSFFMLLQGMLGIQPEAQAGILHVRNPVLPDFVSKLTVENMRVGTSQVSLQFSRYRTRTLVNLLSISGDPLQVRIELD